MPKKVNKNYKPRERLTRKAKTNASSKISKIFKSKQKNRVSRHLIVLLKPIAEEDLPVPAPKPTFKTPARIIHPRLIEIASPIVNRNTCVRTPQHNSLKRNTNARLDDSSPQIANGAFNFSTLETDDSTDDEFEPRKNGRDPPLWSLQGNRLPQINCQARITINSINSFFGTEPQTIDLRTIFPTIPHHETVRRRSSMWKTPVRYSTLPKY